MNLFILAIALIAAYTLYINLMRARHRKFITEFAFPDGLRKKFHATRPGLTEAQSDQVFEGLRQWFTVCNHANKRFVSMPSQVVDDAWHTFILFTRDYRTFCRKAFGRFLHHTPAEAMQDQITATDGIKRSWRLACRSEKINPQKPARLPLLFSLDALLAIPDGFHYILNCTPGTNTYCASGIGCSSGCGGDGGDSSGDGGGCGGD